MCGHVIYDKVFKWLIHTKISGSWILLLDTLLLYKVLIKGLVQPNFLSMKIAFHRAYIGIYIKYYLKQHPLCCHPIFPTLKSNIQFGLEVWPSWFTFLLIDIVPKLSIRIFSLSCLYHVSTCFGGIIDIVLQKWLWLLLVFTSFFSVSILIRWQIGSKKWLHETNTSSEGQMLFYWKRNWTQPRQHSDFIKKNILYIFGQFKWTAQVNFHWMCNTDDSQHSLIH